MKINILLFVVFISLILMAFSGNHDAELIGCTELNGSGCVCHNLQASPEVFVWIEGPDTLLRGQTGLYKMFMYGGPAIAGGYNVASRFGILAVVDSFSLWDYRAPNELTQAFPLPFPSVQDTVLWEFAYIASGTEDTDTIYSCGLSTNWDSIPDYRDLWAFGPKHKVTIIPEVPVELISFAAEVSGTDIILSWSTATEINNSGFIVQKSIDTESWHDIAFIKGFGNSLEWKNYSYIDAVNYFNNAFYRLKQIDFNGSFSFSKYLTVNFENYLPDNFSLVSYPNPFNPITKIRYTIPEGKKVKTVLKVYDLKGNLVSTLVDDVKAAGVYEEIFSASGLSSGVYFYTLTHGQHSQTKKFVLLK